MTALGKYSNCGVKYVYIKYYANGDGRYKIKHDTMQIKCHKRIKYCKFICTIVE